MPPVIIVIVGAVISSVIMLFGLTIGWLIKDRLSIVHDQGFDRGRIGILENTLLHQGQRIETLYETLAQHNQMSDTFRESMARQMSEMNSRLVVPMW